MMMTSIVHRFLPQCWATLLWWLLLSSILASLPDSGLAQQKDGDIVQVFILAGQSNMVGMGSIDHLDLLVEQGNSGTTSRNEHRSALFNNAENGAYRISDHVHVKYGLFNASGPLTVTRDSGFASPGNFGPELMFGFTIGDHYDNAANRARTVGENCARVVGVEQQPVLLIKTAWGGKSLAVDFRPPSAGTGSYDQVKPIQYGQYYRQMIEEVLDTLNHIEQYVPGSTNGLYGLVGFVWFQGWNDMLNYPMVDEYGANLVHFIRDVRLDLDAPGLPFVIGELGMHGLNYTGQGADRVQALRKAQRDVTLLPEFAASTHFVPTASYAVLNGTTYNGIHHYYGRADTYFHIGKALGEGMATLLAGSNIWTVK